MTLYETIDLLKKIALKHPNIGSASEGNIYEYMNANPSIKYGVFFITQGTHSQDEIFNHFEFTLFYVDRLVDDMDENRLQIQSIGKEMLSNILTFFCEEFNAECENISFQPFTQRFADETAGIYSTITIDMPKDIICAEEYWNEDWTAPVTVIRNQDKRVVFTENGTYTIDYDPSIYTGLGTVTVDVNIDVDSFYNSGYGDGYSQGKVDGETEQKSKLETINITENGTYSREDGYNEITVEVPDLNGSYDEGYNEGYEAGYAVSYDEGYEKGQEDIAINARVLDVTENGVYVSKFTQNSDYEMPYEETGDDFWSYATVKNNIYNTGIIPNANTRLEFWFKPDESYYTGGNSVVIMDNNNNYSSFFGVFHSTAGNQSYYANVGRGDRVNFNLSNGVLYHIILSVADGLVINGEQIATFSSSSNFTEPLYINGISSDLNASADGEFGMIKIDDTIIIPTADGFLNTSTNELLEVVYDGGLYEFTEIERPIAEGELYKTINVNVIPKISVKDTGLRLGYSTFTEVPEWLDFEGATDLNYMFYYCNKLQTIPLIDTSNVTNMYNMFYYCNKLQTIPLIDTSNVTNMYNMFGNCGSLQTIPPIDTSNATVISRMFYSSNNLVSLPKFDCTKVTEIDRHLYGTKNNLTDVGGWDNLSCNWNDNYGLVNCPNLTYESCINVLNGLYDFVGNGSTETRTLKVHANFLTTVGDEISIATAKGWSVVS